MKYSKKIKFYKKKRKIYLKNNKKNKTKNKNKNKNKNKTKKILHKMIGGTNTERTIVINSRHFYIDDISTYHIDNYYFKIICTLLINERLGTLIISSITEDFSEYINF